MLIYPIYNTATRLLQNSLLDFFLPSNNFTCFGWDRVNRFNHVHTSWVAIVAPAGRPKSFRNRFVIEVFGGVFVLSHFLDFFVGVGAFVIGLSQISSFFT